MQPLTKNDTVHGRTRSRENWYPLVAAVVAIAAFTLAAGFALFQLRSSAQARVDSSTQNLATSVNQTIDGLFESMDIALQASSDEISRQLATRRPDAQAITR